MVFRKYLSMFIKMVISERDNIGKSVICKAFFLIKKMCINSSGFSH